MEEHEDGDYVLHDDIREIIVKAKQLDALLERAQHALTRRNPSELQDIPEEAYSSM
jgi:hypothetical protein